MRSTAGLRALLATAVVAVAVPTMAQQAVPADRCEGTLCDLYYGNSAPQTAKPQASSAATPLTVPTGGGILSFFTGGATQEPSAVQAPAQSGQRVVAEPGSGGLVAMMKGNTSDRCTGTLCDLYYGGPPPQQPDASARSEATAAAAVDSDAGARAAAVTYVPQREEPTHCVSPSNDPWRCFRR